MHLVQIANIVVSLEYLILSEDSRGEPEPRVIPDGLLRWTLETGRVIELKGDRAELARDFLDDVVIKRPKKARDRQPVTGKTIEDPSSSAPVPEPVSETE